jgi:PEP-CTERM motif
MFLKISSRLSAAAASLALAVSMPATAAVIIDQSAIVATPPVLGRVVVTIGDRVPPAGSTSPPLVNAKVGQSVTAGITGILNAIEVQGPFWNPAFGAAHAFRLSLFDGDLGATHSLIDTVDVPASGFFPPSSALNTATTFFFSVSSVGYAVRPGSMFSFTAELLGPPGAFGLVTVGNVSGTRASPVFEYNQYAGGSAYYSNNGSPFAARPFDVGFRTYVDEVLAPAVPEPSTWAMMLMGFGAVGMAARRRRNAVQTA